jgi:hypothetical protein
VLVSVAGVVQVAVPFTWLGMVLAISFVETPLRFRAPGIAVPLGLGIGRLVFRAPAVAELAFAVALAAALVLATGTGVVGAATWTLIALLWAVLAVQVGVLRPRLDHRARLVVAGEKAELAKVQANRIAGSISRRHGQPATELVTIRSQPSDQRPS